MSTQQHDRHFSKNEEKPSSLLFISEPDFAAGTQSQEEILQHRINKLEKINDALMQRVERSIDQHANAYSLFQTAIVLEAQVRSRTQELRTALRDLERSNRELSTAKACAERANESKTRFLAAASHDLLQPLNAAKLSMSGLIEESIGPDAEMFVQQIKRSLSTIEQLLRTLLDISKLDAGVTKPEIRKFPIEPILRGIHLSFEGDAIRKGLELKVSPAPVWVESDPAFLHRILQNLVSNALNYTDTGSVEVECQHDAKELTISVKDTGIGIAEADHENIFEEFQRLDPAADRHSDGIGLGLGIVRRMAKGLNHPVSLRSKLGAGSVFSITVPICLSATNHDLTGPPARDFTSVHEDAFVVLVEDDSNVLAAMKGLLAKWSCRTIAGRNMSDITAAFEDVERRPDLILVDFHLGKNETGLEIVENLRSLFSCHIPGLVVTADHSEEVARKVRYADCELLTKPVQPAELRALMTYLLGQTKHNR